MLLIIGKYFLTTNFIAFDFIVLYDLNSYPNISLKFYLLEFF